MSDDLRPKAEPGAAHSDTPAEYDPPRIESAMSAGDIEREVFYAGQPVSNGDGGPG